MRFQDVLTHFHVRARAGDLRAVDGQVLQRGVYPGKVLLDGATPAGNPLLSSGSTITVRNGASRTEPVVRSVTHLAGQPANPQFSLGTSSAVRVIVRGKYSGKVVSSTVRLVGPLSVPRAVALTFDDGPSPYTGAILSILKRYKVPATFFVVGYEAVAAPQMVKEEAVAGMTIGNHTWNHILTPPFGTLPPSVIHSEIGRLAALLRSLGIASPVMRPPGGSDSAQVVAQAAEFHDRVVIWNVNAMDYFPGITAARIIKYVLSHVGPGSIVGMHDGGGNRSQTVAALPRIIRGIRAKGLQLVALGPAS